MSGLALVLLVTAVPATGSAPAASEASRSGAIRMGVVAVALPGEGAAAYVPVVVEVDGQSLVQGTSGGALDGTFRLEVTDQNGEVKASLNQAFRLDLEVVGERLLETGLKLFLEVDLEPGSYRARAGIKNQSSERVGGWAGPIEVPRFPSEAGLLLPPLLSEPLEQWVLYRVGEDKGRPFPFLRSDGTPYLPRAMGHWPSTGEVEVDLLFTSASAEPPEVGCRLVDQAGAVVGRPDLTVLEGGPVPGREVTHLLALIVLREVPEGFYDLEITGTGGGDELGVLAARVQVGALDQVPASASGAAVSTTEQRYREVLSVAARDGFENAVVALKDLETGLTSQGRRSEAERLRSAELEVAQDLWGRDGESLIPVVALHVLAAESYLSDEDVWRAALSRMRVEELAALLLERRAETGDGERMAAQILAAAGRCQAALEVDGTNELALLCQGFNLERGGDYTRAVELYRRLVSVSPDHDEGRLRLGINLWRSDQLQEAREVLEGVLSSQAPGPVKVLAYQHLGWLLRDQGELDAAIEAVARGARLHPESQRLSIELAFLLEQNGQTNGAMALLRGLPVTEVNRQESARYWYNRSVQMAIEAARSDLRSEGEAYLNRLASALAGGLGSAAF